MNPDVRHRRADVGGGLHLHWVEAGEGPLVVLLHGFPDFWYGWRYQIPALAEAGYRVVAPDLRGCNGSDKPSEVAAYRVARVADDILGLADLLEAGTFHLVGHDWGGAVGWRLASRDPQRIGRLAVLNAPHPRTYLRELRRMGQLLRSWYILAFQIPGLPELVFRRSDYELVERVIRRDLRRTDVIRDTDFVRYAEAISRPGALESMLNYYRAAFRQALPGLLPGRRLLPPGSWEIPVPTLVIWGERDPYLGTSLLRGLERWVPDLLVERIPQAGHWVQLDAWERVNRTLAWFLDEDAGEDVTEA